jgi:glycosyltransferase involved in cell wall biosynthesis
MRFLMLNWRDPGNPLSGGAERVSLAYLAELVRRGHECSWFANGFPGATPSEIVEGIQVVRGGGKGTSVFAARKWLRSQPRFDLVIDQHHGIPWYAPWWCGTNSIAYIHEVLGPIWHSFYPWPLAVLGRQQERWTHWAYRNVPFWVPSESTRQALHEHGVREVMVFPNGVDTKPLPQLEPKPFGGRLKIIAVSRMAPNKRVDHAIRTVEVLARRGVNVSLTVVGGGESLPGLKGLVAERGLQERVNFTGPLPEIAKNEALCQAHVLVHTSVREGWGLNVIEANAMGTPAVVYPVGGLVDSTLHNETGLVAQTESPESLADACEVVLNSPGLYDRLRLNAWNRARALQWENVLKPACDWLESRAAVNRPSGPVQ